MTILKDIEDIKKLKEGGKILASILREVEKMALPGVKAVEMDKLAEKMIREAGGRPSFKNYKTPEDKIPYPASLCVSINDEVVHGVPGSKVLKNGDIVSLDLGMEYKGLYTDMAITVSVGEIGNEAKRVIDIGKNALTKGVDVVRAGIAVGDIGNAVQSYVEENNFNVVKILVGHGLGIKAHEDPEIPNWGKRGNGVKLQEGLVIAIEPMITTGKADIYLDKDLWTWKTKDKSLSAHFEHTIIITNTGAEIITKI